MTERAGYFSRFGKRRPWARAVARGGAVALAGFPPLLLFETEERLERKIHMKLERKDSG
jgi:formate hydrogenlyase subunit 3/multisubunit Na+/H+ antiporter MnhD subunit